MALELASTTDTPEQIAQTLKDAGYEPEPETAVEAESPVTEPAAGEAPPAPSTIAAAPEAVPEPTEPQATEDEDDVHIVEPEAGQPALPKGVRKEINRLARRRAEERDKRIAAETELTNLKARMVELESRPTQKPPEETKPVEAPPAPKATLKLKEYTQPGGAKFVEGEDYDDAQQRYMDDMRSQLREELAQERTPEKTRAEVQAELDRQARLEEANAHMQATRDRHADFNEKVTDDIKLSPAIIDAAWEDPELAGEVFYYLCAHPEVHKKMMDTTLYPPNSSLDTVLRANRAAAKLVMEITALVKPGMQEQPPPATPPAATPPAAPAPPKPATSTPTKPKVSQAPAPIEPVGSGAAPAAKKNPDSMSPSEYSRWLQTPEGKDWYHSQNR